MLMTPPTGPGAGRAGRGTAGWAGAARQGGAGGGRARGWGLQQERGQQGVQGPATQLMDGSH